MGVVDSLHYGRDSYLGKSVLHDMTKIMKAEEYFAYQRGEKAGISSMLASRPSLHPKKQENNGIKQIHDSFIRLIHYDSFVRLILAL